MKKTAREITFAELRERIAKSEPRWGLSKGRLARQAASTAPLAYDELMAIEGLTFLLSTRQDGSVVARCESYPGVLAAGESPTDAGRALYERIRSVIIDGCLEIEALPNGEAHHGAEIRDVNRRAWHLSIEEYVEQAGLDLNEMPTIEPPAWMQDPS